MSVDSIEENYCLIEYATLAFQAHMNACRMILDGVADDDNDDDEAEEDEELLRAIAAVVCVKRSRPYTWRPCTGFTQYVQNDAHLRVSARRHSLMNLPPPRKYLSQKFA